MSTGGQNAEVREPVRSFMDDPKTKWRLGHPPVYKKVNQQLMEERTRHHKAGSLEELVENLVKTWEMEASHKTDPTVSAVIYRHTNNPLALVGQVRLTTLKW